MKKVKAILLGLITLSIIYLFTSFILWELNAGKWDSSVRFITSASGLVSAIICIAIFMQNDKSN